MASRNTAIGMIFLLQNVVGILRNFLFLYPYIFVHYTGHKLRSTDFILQHLTIANSLVILSKGITNTMAAFGWAHFLSDSGCKLVFYVHRVGRGVSVGTTCLLSIFQFITVSHMNSMCTEINVKIPRYIGSSLIFYV
uniref:Vomeronasal type-1 receptor n=2 Tax=Sus scrofa TaxID=9823 RepID=A0A8W4FLP8_PIG